MAIKVVGASCVGVKNGLFRIDLQLDQYVDQVLGHRLEGGVVEW